MERLDCDIIYDLLPSYIDGICTDATRSCVEVHLTDCPACAERAAQLRETAISGESLEHIALVTARRIKRRMVWRTAVHLALALPFLLFGWLAFNLCVFGRGQIGGIFIYQDGLLALLAVCLLVSVRFSSGTRLQRADYAALTAVLLTMAAAAALMVYGYSGLDLASGLRTPFGIVEPAAVGSLYFRLYGILAAVPIAVCLWAAVRFFKKGIAAVPVFQTALTGAALPLMYLLTMRSMSLDVTVFAEILTVELRDTGRLLILGLGGVALGLLVSKWRAGREKTPDSRIFTV